MKKLWLREDELLAPVHGIHEWEKSDLDLALSDAKASVGVIRVYWFPWCFPLSTLKHRRITGWSHDILEEDKITKVIYLV